MCGCRNKAMREPTDASEPDTQAAQHGRGEARRDIHNHSPSPPQLLLGIVLVCICMCWRHALSFTPHIMPNDCRPYEIDVASGTGHPHKRPATMQNTAVAS